MEESKRYGRNQAYNSINVVEEVAYVQIKDLVVEKTEIERHYELLKHLRENPGFVKEIPDETISDFVSHCLVRNKSRSDSW